MLTRPVCRFTGATMPEMADRILHQEPDALARYNYNVGDDVEPSSARR